MTENSTNEKESTRFAQEVNKNSHLTEQVLEYLKSREHKRGKLILPTIFTINHIEKVIKKTISLTRKKTIEQVEKIIDKHEKEHLKYLKMDQKHM